MRKMTFAAAMGTLALATSASAATISWGASQTITANTDILNPANVVEARNYGGDGGNISVTVGSETVVFTPGASIGTGSQSIDDTFDPAGTSVTPNFESVLDASRWSGSGGAVQISFSGLTDGGSYTLQVFSSDDRDRAWINNLGIDGTETTQALAGKASLFSTATIDLAPGETSFDLDLKYEPGSLADLWLVNAVVLAETLPAAGAITWSSPDTTAISTNAATASANVDTNLTQTVLVWEETTTAPSPLPGSTNDWTYKNVLGPTNAGSVSGQITSLAADTQYTWRFYGENATTSAWSAATTFVTDLSDAQAPAFTGTIAFSSSIQLSWQDNASNETGYVLQRSTVKGSGYTTVGTPGATPSTHIDTGLTPATTYYYQLAATNSASGGSVTDFSLCRTNAKTTAAPFWPLPGNLGELWYDASDTSTVTPSGGGVVTLWEDKSGNNRDATPNVGNPTYTTGEYVAFTKDNMLIANSFTPADPQLFAVIQNTGVNTINYFLGYEDNGFFSGGSYFTGFGLYTNPDVTQSGDAHDANLNVISIATNSVYRNGTSLALTESSAGTVLIDRLGGRTYHTGDFLRLIGNIHEIILFDGALSTDDRQKVEGYLAWKWGLESDLPAVHPYKAAPPAGPPTGTIIFIN